MERHGASFEECARTQLKQLGLHRNASRWDLAAEAWRASVWALTSPDWVPASTRAVQGIYQDLEPVVGAKLPWEEAIEVREHLVAVGDLIRMPGGRWLPAPLRILQWSSSTSPQLVGGMPSWLLAKCHPRWQGSSGFRRTCEEGLTLPSSLGSDWCDRETTIPSIRDLRAATRRMEAVRGIAWSPGSEARLVNPAIHDPLHAGPGSWCVVEDQDTQVPKGIAVRLTHGWEFRALPPQIDGSFARMICLKKSHRPEQWVEPASAEAGTIRVFRKLPGWHWRVLQCHSIRPILNPTHERRRYELTIEPGSLPWLVRDVFEPLNMQKA